MQRIRPATAVVAVITKDRTLESEVAAAVADEVTTVSAHPTPASLLAAMNEVLPDVVILDDRMRGDGCDAIRPLRRRLPCVHIVFVRVRSDKRAIEILHAGADDSIHASSATLDARLQAAVRRARTLNAGTRIALGDIVFDRESHRVWCAGAEVELTPHEYSVVDCMFWHAPKGVNFDTIANFVWGDASSANKKALVQTYVSFVRKKLKNSEQLDIKFDRGVGYKFSPKVVRH